MEKINIKDMNVGELIYLEVDDWKKRGFVIRIINIEYEKYVIDWWKLNNKFSGVFEIIIIGNRDYNMNKEGFKIFNIFRLNKKEILRFKKGLILYNLK